MTFLRPFVRQFPFDETCVQIVDALEARGWRVPGVSVTFHAYGTGEQKLRSVDRIDADDVTIKFGRQQRLLPGGRFYDNAAAHQIAIPGRLLVVYQEESGPTFYLYVGDDWARDRRQFVDGGKVNSKLRGEPRTYLTYGPGCDCRRSFKDALNASFDAAQELRHWHTNQRATLLVCHDDLGREHRPAGDDPIVLRTTDVMAEVDAYLAEHLLTKIRAYPIPRAIDETPDPGPPSALPSVEIGTIFCLGNHRDVKRIYAGKVDPSLQHPADRYGMLAEGLRLVPYSSRSDMTIPSNAHDSFLWCGLARDPDDARSAKIFGDEPSSRDEHVILVRPRTADQIYVADHAAYRRRRIELAMSNPATLMGAPERVRECMAARGRTLLPIADYRGEFEEPIVLVGRELGIDEVEVLGERMDPIDSIDSTDPRSP